MAGERNAPVWTSLVLVVVGVVLVGVAVVYFVEPAKSLPSFFPGHDVTVTRHHVKHGVAAVIVALVVWAAAWIASGTRRSES